ncbi:MAG: hypothetical protein AAFV95_13815 [Bacteroidota bacterium]
MTKIKTLLLVSISLFLCSATDAQPLTQREALRDVCGSVQSYRLHIYTTEIEKVDDTSSYQLANTIEFQFNESGQKLSERRSFFDQGSWHLSAAEYVYRADKKLDRLVYTFDGKLLYENKYSYEAGRTISIQPQNNETDDQYYTRTYHYEAGSPLPHMEKYYVEDELEMTDFFQYDEQGRKTEVLTKFESGSVKDKKVLYEYNQGNQVRKKTILAIDSEDGSTLLSQKTTVYLYDGDCLVSSISHRQRFNGSNTISIDSMGRFRQRIHHKQLKADGFSLADCMSGFPPDCPATAQVLSDVHFPQQEFKTDERGNWIRKVDINKAQNLAYVSRREIIYFD